MVKRTVAYVAAAGIGVTLLAILFFSPTANLDSYGPPAMILSTGSGVHEAGIGSYCGQIGPFTGKCADRTLEGSVPDEVVAIPEGSQFEVRIVDYPHPELLQITLRDEDLNATELELTRVSPTTFVTDIPQGKYVMSFFTKWEDAGMSDASYFYQINVI